MEEATCISSRVNETSHELTTDIGRIVSGRPNGVGNIDQFQGNETAHELSTAVHSTERTVSGRPNGVGDMHQIQGMKLHTNSPLQHMRQDAL